MTAPYPPATPGTPPAAPKNGFGVTALVLGIVGAFFSLIPLIGIIAWPMVLAGLVFGVLGIVRGYTGKASNKAMAIIGTVLSGLGLVFCIAYTASFSTAMSKLPESAPGTGEAAGGSTADVQQRGFGQSYTWPGGETISVSAPTEHVSTNPYLGPPQGKRLAEVQVTVHNGSKRPYNVVETTMTAQHAGRVAQQSYTNGDPLPNTELPPGGDVTFTAVFETGETPGEFRLSVKPNSFATNTVYWTGQF